MRRKENRTIIKGAFVKKSIQLFKKKKNQGIKGMSASGFQSAQLTQ